MLRSMARLGSLPPPKLPRAFMSSSSQTSWKEARFQGANIELGSVGCLEAFTDELSGIMESIRNANRKGVWLRVPLEQAAIIPIAARHGFRFHHAEGDHAMLLAWLPETTCPVPDFATHVIGVGGFTLNAKNEVLVVKEARAPNVKSQGSWKLPGGLIELGEELGDGVTREVQEETGVTARFKSVLAFRHQHGAAFGRGGLGLGRVGVGLRWDADWWVGMGGVVVGWIDGGMDGRAGQIWAMSIPGVRWVDVVGQLRHSHVYSLVRRHLRGLSARGTHVRNPLRSDRDCGFTVDPTARVLRGGERDEQAAGVRKVES